VFASRDAALEENPMTAENYKAERKLRGTQTGVAAQLGVTQPTMSLRESGTSPITREMMLAICALPKLRNKKNREL
jgi:hypothetical protein